MKQNKNIFFAFILLIIAGALYRIVPGRPWGFAPQLAMAVFGGAVIKDKKWGFAVPLCSMLLSDLLFEVLNRMGYVHDMPGFYAGQWLNYILLSSAALLGMRMKRINVVNIAGASLAAPVLYFLLSNFSTWAMGGGWGRPYTAAGLWQSMLDGVPFFSGSLMATIGFNALFFGAYMLRQRLQQNAMDKALA